MVPAFNCAHYLRQTLASVLAQDPGPQQMQIEVVDDFSMRDDPEAVVRELGGHRVAFYRKAKNGGVNANFNTCVERSRGHLVHILHGDDYVLPGFYARIARAAEEHPEIALFASRSFIVDEENVVLGVTERLREWESGARGVEPFFYHTPIQTPGVVVRRSFYEKHGGFLPELAHTADCEMWARAITRGGGLVTPEVLSSYRRFAANDTGRLARTAENLRDLERLHGLWAQQHSGFVRTKALIALQRQALLQAEVFRRQGDAEGVKANLNYCRHHASLFLRLRFHLVQLFKAWM